MARSDIKGMKELENSIKQLGKLPQKCVNKAARNGAKIAIKDAKAKAPNDTGDLKKGIVLKPERRTKLGKKVFQVTFDRNMNHKFVKISKEGKRSYYPASQEYGFFARNGRYIPGYRYMKNALVHNKKQIEEEIVDVLSKEIDKELGKG